MTTMKFNDAGEVTFDLTCGTAGWLLTIEGQPEYGENIINNLWTLATWYLYNYLMPAHNAYLINAEGDRGPRVIQLQDDDTTKIHTLLTCCRIDEELVFFEVRPTDVEILEFSHEEKLELVRSTKEKVTT